MNEFTKCENQRHKDEYRISMHPFKSPRSLLSSISSPTKLVHSTTSLRQQQ